MTAPAFYRVTDDVNARGRWHLYAPRHPSGRELDESLFRRGVAYRSQRQAGARLLVPLQRTGQRLDWTFAGIDLPVVTQAVKKLLSTSAPLEVQFVPCRVEGQGDDFCIVNPLDLVDCLDARRSEIMYWEEEDGRKDKVGKPRMITTLFVDPSKAEGRSIFRIQDWTPALIVSANLRSQLLRAAVRGIRFEAV